MARSVLAAGSGGKDLVMVAAREELATPSAVVLPEPSPAPGLILPDGSINWGCPCLGGMATGPCGHQFRDAFSCFHYSSAEPKGSECYELFSAMQECMARYPQLYGRDGDGDADSESPLSAGSPAPPLPAAQPAPPLPAAQPAPPLPAAQPAPPLPAAAD